MPVDGLAEELTARAQNWSDQYDQDNRARNREYYRMWRGEWSPEDRTRESERSRAIMPSLSQAIDAAVSDVMEAFFSREQWLDTGDALLDDALIADFWDDRPHIEEATLIGALYGTLTGKIIVRPKNGRPSLNIQALEPGELIVDPAATTLDECLGIGHHVFIPRWIIERRMRDGIYNEVELEGSGEMYPTNPGESQPRDTDYIEILEWHGLIPINEIAARERTDQLKNAAIGDDGLVEAICTIANKETILRCEANPFGSDRPFVTAQWHTVPRRIHGRGIGEMAYWPQKSIDAEMRARQDALAFTIPMMVINGQQVPRNQSFEMRPGRRIFSRGDSRTAISTVQFPGPDPGTYQQTIELQRMIELGTGQLSQANPIGDMSRTGSGPLSAVLGASVKRQSRTILNIERDFIVPIVQKAALRMNALRPEEYPQLNRRPKINSGVGIMMRELENQQLATLMTNLPDGPAQLQLLRMIVDGSSIREKSRVLQIIDEMTERAMAPEQMTPDQELAMASMQQASKESEARIQLDMAKVRLDTQKASKEHERQLLQMLRQEEESRRSNILEEKRINSEAVKRDADSVLALAKATDGITVSLEELKAQVASMPVSDNAPLNLSAEALTMLAQLQERIDGMPSANGRSPSEPGPFRIERDAQGLITSIGGLPTRRNAQGLIEEVG